MKIVVVSDIHSNLAAIKALPEERYDQLWCLGDIVNYGPQPHEAIRWVESHADVAIRGNHDHAVAFDVTPECSRPWLSLAAVTRHYTQRLCTPNDISYLRQLPLRREVVVEDTRFQLVHGSPSDPLFGYLPEDSEEWAREVERIHADFLFVGHMHTPFIRRIGGCTIVNPGSVGQPKTGRFLACYATWEDGDVELKEYAYPVEETIKEIRRMSIPTRDQRALISALSPDPSALSLDGLEVCDDQTSTETVGTSVRSL